MVSSAVSQRRPLKIRYSGHFHYPTKCEKSAIEIVFISGKNIVIGHRLSARVSQMTRLRPEERRKQQIRSAAMRCFVQRGYEATRLSDIASEAGLSKGGIYFHYRSKEDLFLDLLDNLGLSSSQRWLYDAAEGYTPQRVLRHFVENHWRRLLESPEEARIIHLLLAMAGQQTVFEDRLEVVFGPAIGAYTNIIERGVAAGVFVSAEPAKAALAIVAHIHGLAAFSVLGSPAQFSLADVVDHVFRMLAPRSASSVEFGSQESN